MSASAPFRYLVGSESAIRELAAWRGTLRLGFVLVATAGVARHYDDNLGLVGFWWLIGPVIASVVSSLIVFGVVALTLKPPRAAGGERPPSYEVFLGLFWMTAPCAWIYAIPVEHWNDDLGAAKWNVAFLVFVAGWRVLIIARACQVLTGRSWWLSLWAVLCPAGLEFAAVSWLLGTGRSVATSMGGIRDLDPKDEFLINVHSTGTTVGVALGIVALIGLNTIRSLADQSDSVNRINAARSSEESDL